MKKVFNIIIFLFAIMAIAQKNVDKKIDNIDSLISHAIQNDVFNGAVLIYFNGEVIYNKSNGFQNVEVGLFNNINTLFNIGSISKQYCAVGIMHLSDLGLLNVDDKYSKYFPDFPQGNKFTIRHLLNHTAGIPNWTISSQHPFFRVTGRPGDFIDGITDEVVYNYLKKYNKLDFNPGERYSYSNSGYVLLSHLIAKVSGKPYWQFMKEEVFIPLGLENTFISSYPDLDQARKAIGYGNFGQKDDNNLLTGGDGGVYTTVPDMHKWNLIIKSSLMLSNQAYKEIFKIPTLNNGKELRTNNDYSSSNVYGFGWIFNKRNGENIIMHDGGINGISAINYVDINRDFEIILCSNKGTSSPLYPIQDNIIKILHNQPFELYKTPVHLKLKSVFDSQGFEAGILWFNSLDKSKKDLYEITPNHLNSLGYFYLNNMEVKKAKKIFQLNLQMFRDNGNLWDSYAEAFYRNKEYLVSLALYEKSLQLTPDNDNAKRIIQTIKQNLN